MKKLLLFLCCLLTLGSAAFDSYAADDGTLNFTYTPNNKSSGDPIANLGGLTTSTKDVTISSTQWHISASESISPTGSKNGYIECFSSTKSGTVTLSTYAFSDYDLTDINVKFCGTAGTSVVKVTVKLGGSEIGSKQKIGNTIDASTYDLTLNSTDIGSASGELTIIYENVGTASSSNKVGGIHIGEITIKGTKKTQGGGGEPDPVVVPVPEISVSNENPVEGDVVTVTITADGNTIFYTTDGSDPNDGEEYENPFTVTETCTIRAIAMDDDANISDEATPKTITFSPKQTEPDPVDPTTSGTATFDFKSHVSELIFSGATFDGSDFKFDSGSKTVADKNGNVVINNFKHSTNPTTYYKNNSNFRTYTGNTFDIVAPVNTKITKIVFTPTGKDNDFNITITNDDETLSGSNGTWTAPTTFASNTVSVKGNAKSFIDKIEVSYEAVGSVEEPKPTEVTVTVDDKTVTAGDSFAPEVTTEPAVELTVSGITSVPAEGLSFDAATGKITATEAGTYMVTLSLDYDATKYTLTPASPQFKLTVDPKQTEPDPVDPTVPNTVTFDFKTVTDISTITFEPNHDFSADSGNGNKFNFNNDTDTQKYYMMKDGVMIQNHTKKSTTSNVINQSSGTDGPTFALRVYDGNGFTITAPDGASITKVVFGPEGNGATYFGLTGKEGTSDSTEKATPLATSGDDAYIWTSANGVTNATFTGTKTNRIQTITVYLKEVAPAEVVLKAEDLDVFVGDVFAAKVAATVDGEPAEVEGFSYVLDSFEPASATEEAKTGLTISEDGATATANHAELYTVKGHAVYNDKLYSVAEPEFEFLVEVSRIPVTLVVPDVTFTLGESAKLEISNEQGLDLEYEILPSDGLSIDENNMLTATRAGEFEVLVDVRDSNKYDSGEITIATVTVEKKTAVLTWESKGFTENEDGELNFRAYNGKETDFPTLKLTAAPEDAEITYQILDSELQDATEYAEIDAEGAITLKKATPAGEPVSVWANFAGNDEYKSASEYYLLTIIEPHRFGTVNWIPDEYRGKNTAESQVERGYKVCITIKPDQDFTFEYEPAEGMDDASQITWSYSRPDLSESVECAPGDIMHPEWRAANYLYTFTATYFNGTENETKDYKVAVKTDRYTISGHFEKSQIHLYSNKIRPGKVVNNKVEITGGVQPGHPYAITYTITNASEENPVAELNADGLVTLTGNVGICTVYAHPNDTDGSNNWYSATSFSYTINVTKYDEHTFNFNSPGAYGMNTVNTGSYEGGSLDLESDMEMDVHFKINNTATSNSWRHWNHLDTHYAIRIYNGIDDMEISLETENQNCVLERVEFIYASDTNHDNGELTLVGENAGKGTLTNVYDPNLSETEIHHSSAVWEAGEDDFVRSIRFKPASTVNLQYIDVVYSPRQVHFALLDDVFELEHKHYDQEFGDDHTKYLTDSEHHDYSGELSEAYDGFPIFADNVADANTHFDFVMTPNFEPLTADRLNSEDKGYYFKADAEGNLTDELNEEEIWKVHHKVYAEPVVTFDEESQMLNVLAKHCGSYTLTVSVKDGDEKYAADSRSCTINLMPTLDMMRFDYASISDDGSNWELRTLPEGQKEGVGYDLDLHHGDGTFLYDIEYYDAEKKPAAETNGTSGWTASNGAMYAPRRAEAEESGNGVNPVTGNEWQTYDAHKLPLVVEDGDMQQTAKMLYLRLNTNGVSKDYSVSFTQGVVTDIESIEAADAEDGEVMWFDLNGFQVKEPSDGIFVRVSRSGAQLVRVR